MLVSVNFGCFSPSRFSDFHCNAMRKAIKVHKNLHTDQQNEHTPENCLKIKEFGLEGHPCHPPLDPPLGSILLKKSAASMMNCKVS